MMNDMGTMMNGMGGMGWAMGLICLLVLVLLVLGIAALVKISHAGTEMRCENFARKAKIRLRYAEIARHFDVPVRTIDRYMARPGLV